MAQRDILSTNATHGKLFVFEGNLTEFLLDTDIIKHDCINFVYLDVFVSVLYNCTMIIMS